MNVTAIIATLALASLGISLLIETSSWWLRSSSTQGSVGLYVSRTNIYLYGGRFFALLFSTFIAFLVDRGAGTESLLIIFMIGFAITGAAHVLLLNNTHVTLRIIARIARLMRLSPPEMQPMSHRSHQDHERVRLPTALSSMFFGFGLSMPYVLASALPEYRLTIGNLGQIINSFGTLLLLFWVDQRLFAALDRNNLREAVVHYAAGRAIGFFAVAGGFALGAMALAF